MAKRNASAKIIKKPNTNLTPEQQRAAVAEKEMLDFLDKEGVQAMIDMQVEWKANDIRAKIGGASNIKAWFETSSEIMDLNNKGLDILKGKSIEEATRYYNDFKIQLYKDILDIYENGIKEEDFGFAPDEFVNPFGELWAKYDGKREDISDALIELYAWTLMEDPVLWASGLNSLIFKSREDKEFKED